MAVTTFKKGTRAKVKKTGQVGTVTEVRTHDPSGGGGGFYVVKVVVRLDGEKDERAFEEPELEQLVTG